MLEDPWPESRPVAATVEKALQVIEALSAAKGPCGVTQLSRDLRLNKSTVYRLLETLRRYGYVRQDDDLSRYTLTPKLWQLGVGVIRDSTVHSVAPAYLRAAADASGETVLLAIPDGDHVLVSDKVDSSQSLRIVSPIGSRLPAYCTALGRAMLFDADEASLRLLLSNAKRFTEHTVTRVEALVAAVRVARREGYSVAVDEYLDGVTAVAAPVRDSTGEIVASLAITAPTSRLGQSEIERLGREAVEAAAAISQALGNASGMHQSAAE